MEEPGIDLRVCLSRGQLRHGRHSQRGSQSRGRGSRQKGNQVNAMSIRRMATIGVIGLTLAVVPLRAHHAFTSEFDASKPVKLRGTVTKVELINPHSWIHIDVKNPDGSVTNWAIEGGTPNTLFRLGVNKDSL